ncbi:MULTISPECIES: HAD-IC family P-type ATPase [unclassified Streptomyces]|uniref:HAD-IC family P-type ATPase n=1 Tax=Streptomyces TaxID=1883 RepID=UPI001039BB09|nr:HAD-IC family P-type ATPase [Streptomyces sp. COG21]MBT3088978.1 HAD-IC family P-type ATPase [Streptomyces sp. CYG21]MBT3097792.1 HAD-IC family P-type ATPase [Streptomyces sp. CBG30]MBT3103890.1 HAD-IC family P-type ATPase [Streptomyces sp. COG19]MBT3113296.1 HAD-IC family P-type ATPase [Streptomyces sp. CYG20]
MNSVPEGSAAAGPGRADPGTSASVTPFPGVDASVSASLPESVSGTEPESVPESVQEAVGGAGSGALGRSPGAGPGAPQVKTSLEILRSLDSGPRGLVEARAEERLARFGENVLPAWRPVPWPRRFVRSLRDPFTSVLLCLGLVSAVVSAWGTACVILALVAVSCLLRSAEEHRADRSTAALRDLVATTATVVRRVSPDAAPLEREVPVADLVPGDVIRLGPGDLVPADVQVLRAGGLTVHQSALTGESAPVTKHPLDTPDPALAGAGPFAQPQLCFQGSSVTSGSGTAVIVATGGATRFAAAHDGRARQRGASAFDRSVQGISWTLIRFMLLTPPLVLMANAALRGRGLETLPFAVAVAVGLTPEMLPVIVTTALARGASRLARTSGVIVKRLPALHDLGAVDVLCLDKTGTLTEDRPVVAAAVDSADRPDPEVLRWAALSALWTLQLAELPAPDALDEAVLDAAEEAEGWGACATYEGVAALPFDPVRRVATAVVRRPGRLGVHTLVTKGAVEAVLERCALDGDERERLLALADRKAESGLRLLAVARADRPARPGAYTPADERRLTFVGLVALRDVPAPSAAEALGVLARRGVTVKVLTGDHPGTAARACADLGLGLRTGTGTGAGTGADTDGAAGSGSKAGSGSGADAGSAIEYGDVVTAELVDTLSDAELARVADRATVFARCTPEHKARIVSALRAAGHTTGFLGDGVNDLPALHAADVGICPRNAVDVAREAADVVLAEKDLTAIDRAVLAGRHSSGNIATYLRITLSSNLGNVIAMLTAGLMLPFLPMLPAQVLVQNLCFDAAQLAFAFDRPAASALRRPAVLRSRDFLRFITGFGLLNAAADLATFGVLALALHNAAGDGEAAFHAGWFTENLLTQALVMVLLRTGRSAAERRAGGPLRAAAAGLAVVGVLLPLTPVGPLLGMSALPPLYYLLLGSVLGLYAVGLTAARRRYERRHPADDESGRDLRKTDAGR